MEKRQGLFVVFVLVLLVHIGFIVIFSCTNKDTSVSSGRAENILAKSDKSSQSPVVASEQSKDKALHTVVKGECLWKIGKKYGVKWQEIKRVKGNIEDPDLIYPGWVLVIPSSNAVVVEKKQETNPQSDKILANGDKPSQNKTAVAESNVKSIRSKTNEAKEIKQAPTLHSIVKCNCLYKIGRKCGIDWCLIYDANKETITNPNQLQPGKVLSIPALKGAEAAKTALGAKKSAPEMEEPIRDWLNLGGDKFGPYRDKIKAVMLLPIEDEEVKEIFMRIVNGRIHAVEYAKKQGWKLQYIENYPIKKGHIYLGVIFGNYKVWGLTRGNWKNVDTALARLYVLEHGGKIHFLADHHECDNVAYWVEEKPPVPPKNPEPPAPPKEEVPPAPPKEEVPPAPELNLMRMEYEPEPRGELVRIYQTVIEKRDERGPHLELITEYRFDKPWRNSRNNNQGIGNQASLYSNNKGDWWFGPAAMFDTWWGKVDTYRYNGNFVAAGVALKYEKPFWNVKTHVFLGSIFEDGRDDWGFRTHREFYDIFSGDFSISAKNINQVIPIFEEVNFAIWGMIDPGHNKYRSTWQNKRILEDIIGKDNFGLRVDLDFQSFDFGQGGKTLTVGTGWVYDSNKWDWGTGPFVTLALGQRHLDRTNGGFRYYYPPRKFVKIYWGIDIVRETYLFKVTLFWAEGWYALKDAQLREILEALGSRKEEIREFISPERQMLYDLSEANFKWKEVVGTVPQTNADQSNALQMLDDLAK